MAASRVTKTDPFQRTCIAPEQQSNTSNSCKINTSSHSVHCNCAPADIKKILSFFTVLNGLKITLKFAYTYTSLTFKSIRHTCVLTNTVHDTQCKVDHPSLAVLLRPSLNPPVMAAKRCLFLFCQPQNHPFSLLAPLLKKILFYGRICCRTQKACIAGVCGLWLFYKIWQKNRLHLNVLQWPNLKLSSQKWHLQFPTQVCGRYGNDGQVFGQDDDLHCGAYK